jgi:hypothetical protein
MADLLTQFRREIDARLIELRPVVDEVRRLERAREALGRTNGPGRKPPARTTAARKRPRMSKAESGELDRRVLALLSEDPTQKLAALALLTDTSSTSMGPRLNRLVKQGQLKKRRRGNSTRYEVPRPQADVRK